MGCCWLLQSLITDVDGGHGHVPCTRTGTQASQLIFGGIGKGAHLAIKPAETVNLTAGIIAAGSAAQSTDMTGTYPFRAPRRSNSNGELGASSGDLKTGYLLRAKPRNQFVAQLCGAVVAIFLNVGLFILFTTASPCIL